MKTAILLPWASLLSFAAANNACTPRPPHTTVTTSIVSPSQSPSHSWSETTSTSIPSSFWTTIESSTSDSSSISISTPTPDTTLVPTSTPSSSEFTSTSTTISSSTTSAQCFRPTAMSGALAPSTGDLVVAVIFIDFPDAPVADSTEELYSVIKNGPAETFTKISNGKLNLKLVPHLDRVFRMPQNHDSYNYQRGFTAEDHRRYIQDALASVGTAVSFAGVNVLYLVPSKGATQLFSSASRFPVFAVDGTAIGNAITFGYDLFSGAWARPDLIVNHETGHVMGLPDLYPYSGGRTDQFVGGFDMMGLVSAQSPDYLAYSKWLLGWIEPSQVACVDTAPGTTSFTISPIEVAAGATKLVVIQVSSILTFAVEVRSHFGINSGACGTGVLIYSAHQDLGSGQGPLRVIDSKPGSGGCDPNNGGELNDAPFDLYSKYESEYGFTVSVVGKSGNDYVVHVTRK